MFKMNSYKIAHTILLASLVSSGFVQADNMSIDKAKALEQIKLTDSQLLREKQALANQISKAARLEKEQVNSSEIRLSDLMGAQKLQFSSAIARVYSENDYLLLWENDEVRKFFLKEYAAFVASGISPKSSIHLKDIDNQSNIGGLIYDILITDAFLDYMYYTKNVKDYAQKWLYSSNGYRAKTPLEKDIDLWLSAMKNHQGLVFIQSLSTKNSVYLQTLAKLSELSSGELNNVTTSQLNKLALNLQRLRVIPEFKNGIFVNIPSYHLNYYRDGKLVLNSKVIVGKVSRKTPVMYSRLSNVVVNPPWTPTVKLINEDIVPKIKKNPNYVANHNYTITDYSGNVVDPHLINWSEIKGRFPYRVRQAAGGSALGNYKFNMPSSDAIYLHDTPHHGLFAKKNRALSSGCVRVEKSDQLATILLKEVGWSESRKNAVLKSRKTSSANINSDNPVYLYYVTQWVENNSINDVPDIYGYDKIVSPNKINWVLIQKYLG